jgi:2-iminobutanoate/2-iminopropanoate deaminase
VTRHAVRTDRAPQAIGPYSQAVAVDGLLFLSGQIGLDPATGDLIPGGIEVETERVLSNIEAVLAAEGLDMNAVVRTTIYLADLADFAAVNQIYAHHFREPFPARVTVGVAHLPKRARIEIDAIAVTGKG